MKAYWDSSALIKALHEEKLRLALKPGKDGTRPHSLAEVFSTLTKGVGFHYSPADAATLIETSARSLDFVELSADDAVAVIKGANSPVVRGARIHDLMHAAAAKKYQATVIFTLDTAGFATLKTSVLAQAP